MPKNPPPPPSDGQLGHNSEMSKEELARIENLTKEIIALEAERSAVNESIGERRAAIKAMGIDMDAWRGAKRRKAMDPDDRKNFDRSQQICNEALGVPIQADLFANDDTGSLPASLN